MTSSLVYWYPQSYHFTSKLNLVTYLILVMALIFPAPCSPISWSWPCGNVARCNFLAAICEGVFVNYGSNMNTWRPTFPEFPSAIPLKYKVSDLIMRIERTDQKERLSTEKVLFRSFIKRKIIPVHHSSFINKFSQYIINTKRGTIF